MGKPALMDIEQQLESYILGVAKESGKVLQQPPRTLELIDSQIFDSLSLLEFVMHVEQLAGIKIPGEDILPEHFNSIASILAYLRQRHGFE